MRLVPVISENTPDRGYVCDYISPLRLFIGRDHTSLDFTGALDDDGLRDLLRAFHDREEGFEAEPERDLIVHVEKGVPEKRVRRVLAIAWGAGYPHVLLLPARDARVVAASRPSAPPAPK